MTNIRAKLGLTPQMDVRPYAYVCSCHPQLHHNYSIEVFDNALKHDLGRVYANDFIVVGGFDFMLSQAPGVFPYILSRHIVSTDRV